MIKIRMLWILACLSSSSPVYAESFLNIRLPIQGAAALVATIAKVGAPFILREEKGSSLIEGISQRCGPIDPFYLRIFLDANPGLTKDDLKALRVATEVTYPACVSPPKKGEVKMTSTDLISRVARSKKIAIDPTAFEQVSKIIRTKSSEELDYETLLTQELKPKGLLANFGIPSAYELTGLEEKDSNASAHSAKKYYELINTYKLAILNNGLDSRRLQAGDTVVFPGIEPTWSSVPVRDGVATVEAINQIKVAMASSGIPLENFEETPNATLIGTVDAAASCLGRTDNWPFDMNKLIDVLAANKAFVQKKLIQTSISKVLVLDTGFDFASGSFPEFPPSFISSIKGLAPDTIRSKVGFVPGVNLATRTNDPSSAIGYDDRWHGLGVAEVALGSTQLKSLRTLMSFPINLAFASVVRARGGAGFIIDPEALYRAYSLAFDNDIGIINVSVSLPASTKALKDASTKYGRSVLVIAAAGNDREEMSDHPIYPAGYGGDPKNGLGAIVVTVGAHDGNGNIADFSRKGAAYIDLLAPGCSVPTLSSNLTANSASLIPASLSGTSFAAPIVTFVSALLRSYGLSAAEIKARLDSSVDASDELNKLVYSRGRLNAFKSLSLWNDVVEYWDENLKRRILSRGLVTNKRSLISVCGSPVKVSELRKLAFPGKGTEKEPPGQKAHIWRETADHDSPELIERLDLCDVQSSERDATINFTPDESDAPITIPLRNLYDYVSSTL